MGREGPAGGADGIEKDRPFLGHPVNVGTGIPFISIAAQMIRAQSINRDQKNIEFILPLLPLFPPAGKDQPGQKN